MLGAGISCCSSHCPTLSQLVGAKILLLAYVVVQVSFFWETLCLACWWCTWTRSQGGGGGGENREVGAFYSDEIMRAGRAFLPQALYELPQIKHTIICLMFKKSMKSKPSLPGNTWCTYFLQEYKSVSDTRSGIIRLALLSILRRTPTMVLLKNHEYLEEMLFVFALSIICIQCT